MIRLPKIFLVLVSLLFLCTGLSAQTRYPGILSGRVTDSQNGQPVEYANIVLRTVKTDSMVTGTVSDSSGLFRMKNVPYGTYLVEFSFIGYVKQRSGPITIDQKRQKADVGVLKLVPSSVTFDEVTITGEKSMMINKIDRKVFNVQKDIAAQTGTVTDMLQTIPSVSVDIDGNISLRGSGSVTILINGRPSVMSGSANLEQMPASIVERIEVITNPSARYRPDGTAGIINIVLKKQRKAGFNTTAGVNAGNNSRFNTNLQLNMSTGKLNLFGSYGYRQDYRFRSGELSAQNIDTASHISRYQEQTSSGTSRSLSHLVQLGSELTFGAKDAAGLSGTWNYRNNKRSNQDQNLYKNDTLLPVEQYTRTLDGHEGEQSWGLTTFWEHVFNRETEHILRIDAEYQQSRESEDDYWTNDFIIPDTSRTKDHTIGDNGNGELNISVDYSTPLWKNASLESGYQQIVETDDVHQDVEHMDAESGNWVTDTASGNRFRSTQTVWAMYGTVTWAVKKFTVMAGLRAEEALMNLEFLKQGSSAKSNYFAVYPTVHLSLASGSNEWQLNYSRRVNRPDGEEMNPVPEYRDPRNIYKGNPDLKPEDIHSIEFGYAVHPDKFTFIPAIFYRYTANGFTRVSSSLNDSTMMTTMENLAKDQSAGVDLSGTARIAGILNLNFSASGFYNRIDASNIGYSGSRSAISWNAKLNASVNITKTTMFQLNSQYRSEVLTPQGFRSPSWVVNLGFRQDFWKKKLSLIATVSDLFNSQMMKSTANTPVLVQETMRRRDARVIYCGLLFNYGTTGKKSKEARFEFDNGL